VLPKSLVAPVTMVSPPQSRTATSPTCSMTFTCDSAIWPARERRLSSTLRLRSGPPTAGQTMRDFSDDRAALRATLLRLTPHPISSAGSLLDCPRLTYTRAALIAEFNEASALEAAVQDAMVSLALSQGEATIAERQVQGAARLLVESSRRDALATLGAIREIVRRTSTMPGQRSVVLVSPGFVTPGSNYELMDLIDHAIRGNVTISAIDARGVYVNGLGRDISAPAASTARPTTFGQIERSEAFQQDAVLAEMADATGGMFAHGTNDLAAGFSRAAAPVEYTYVTRLLAAESTPERQIPPPESHPETDRRDEPDSVLRLLRPNQAETAEEQSRREIEEARFSREEAGGLPIQLHLQSQKVAGTKQGLLYLCRSN
jgi:VWFA-related protein